MVRSMATIGFRQWLLQKRKESSLQMATATLQDVLAINREIATLADAGVPIRLGATASSTTGTLERINESLKLRSSLGQEINEAVADNPDLPGIYQHALQVGLATGDSTLTLAGVSHDSAVKNELHTAMGRALVQPLIVLALAYCGFILLCTFFVPEMTDIYEQIRQAPGLPLRILEACRATMPVWIPLVPILVLIAMVLWRRSRGAPPRWIPGARRYVQAVKNALIAEELARLAEAKIPLTEATFSLAATQNTEPAEPTTLPPLLHWAVTGNLDEQSLPGVLRIAAQSYRQSAQRLATVWQTALPILLGSLLGGTIVLLYGLSVFWPYIQMLRDLTR